jgi:HAD superfamily hydrolase (TIGR01509 family)
MSKNAFPHAVLWDMDGTLVDSEHYWSISQNRLAQSYGAEWTKEDETSVIGSSLYDSSEMIRQKFGIVDRSVQEIIDHLTEEVIQQLRSSLPWRPGALELLMDLRSAGIKTALVTMSMRRMALAVAESIPFPAFDVVIAGDDVRFGKPHPEPYLLATEKLGVDPSHCIAFEDSIPGLASAAAAGTHAVGVVNMVPLQPGPDRRIISSLVGLGSHNLHELRIYD